MTRNIIAIDLDSCIGCHSCAVVCKQENNVGLGTYYNKVLTVGPFGTYLDLEMYYLPVQCQHCADPECVKVCPTGASHKLEDGTVQNYAESVNERYLREMAYFLDYAQSGAGPSVNTPETALDVLKLTLGEL